MIQYLKDLVFIMERMQIDDLEKKRFEDILNHENLYPIFQSIFCDPLDDTDRKKNVQ